MKPISAYAALCMQLSEEQFCAKKGHPFLLHSNETGNTLKPLDVTRGETIDRLVLAGEGGHTMNRSLEVSDLFTVFELASREAGTKRITINWGKIYECQSQDG